MMTSSSSKVAAWSRVIVMCSLCNLKYNSLVLTNDYVSKMFYFAKLLTISKQSRRFRLLFSVANVSINKNDIRNST